MMMKKLIKKLLVKKIVSILRKSTLTMIFESDPILHVPAELKTDFNRYFDWATYRY